MKAVCKAEAEDDVDDDVLDSFTNTVNAVPKTPEQKIAATLEHVSPKKTVRWADEKPSALEEPAVAAEEKRRISPIHDGTFWEGWRHTKRSQRARDVFLHRQARAEAEHVKRISSQKQHLDQLQGRYQITCTDRPAPSRPISDLLAKPDEDDKADVIGRAERERQALEQMQSSSWHLAAHREIAGGKLLTSPIVQSFKGRTDVRILDVDGQVHCGWAWSVALEHPDAAVYTTVSSDAEAHVAQSTLDGPANHCVVAAPKPWELPFADNHFDIISARNLYANLKTVYPQSHAADEWDLTLQECLRCLKPGGYLEFNLLDAELAHPEPACQALGVEFAFSLKTRGYDPCSGRTFLPRLKRAGFESIKRAWMILPVADVIPRWQDLGKSCESADAIATEKIIGPNGEVSVYAPAVVGSTRDVRAMTGLVGARMWEQWILKLHCEMGREEARGLEGVAKALEECGKGNAGWRCLVGWARKAAV
ncbi:hypothetical protein BDY17DRAFT_253596 [Neohortaea acidophila]|uniref:Methyltransferase type 11 domain-containing protein n=1 Tax=Neohortaea acidophila TaxID=245834 RepID=A0A6A6PMB5_9PEZI|nr:uncharacterized protein BDY17DRAFT_253596 [Neohortaea acidophila]KAF2481132.1 hypothetical protein BDY17DRAFT_253596 [Neohortaea acidophila]